MEEHDDLDLAELEKKEESHSNFLNPRDLQSAVFLPGTMEEPVPAGFSIVQINLNGTVRSDLDWSLEKTQAQTYIASGLKILWNLNLGLFEHLDKPIENQTQFLSLTLSIEHFRDTIWKEFSEHTAAVCIYQGPLDYRKDFFWSDVQKKNFFEWLSDRFENTECFINETGISVDSFSKLDIHQLEKHDSGMRLLALYCRDACTEYLALLAFHLPHEVPALLLLDGNSNSSWELEALLLHRERFSRFLLGIQGNKLPIHEAFIWTSHALRPVASEKQRLAFCLPPASYCKPSHTANLEVCLQKISSLSVDYKIIPEENLTSEWDGLDYLFFNPAGLTSQGKRKLHGFSAAGGEIVAFGDPNAFQGAISFNEFTI
jgi:hypothetical protein